MRISFLLLLMLVVSGRIVGQNDKAGLESLRDSMSYALGLDIGTNLNNLDLELQPELIMKGLADAIEGREGELDEATVKNMLQVFQNKAREAQSRKQKMIAEQAKAEGELFMKDNAEREGVTTTASGLQYEVLRPGEGEKPGPNSKVKVHYEGRLLNGKIFDSSYQRGEPIEFGLNSVIKGWSEGVQLMNTGAKFRFFIPPDLAYGERGAPPSIGPNATLVFDVELLEVKPQ